ncbi:DUF3761 domain-containing protein [Geodermatophilus sp. SYSU D00691]
MATSQRTGGGRPDRKKKFGVGLVGGIFALGLIGSIGSGDTETTPTASEQSATSSAAPSSSAPAPRSTPAPRTTAPSSTAAVAPAPPAPVMAMSCPAGSTNASPVFGHQITATAPFTVVIDYGDGDVYTNDDQHLGAIFSHTYRAAGSFTVHAVLTDATGRTVDAACAYSWTRPAPPPAPAPAPAPAAGGGSSSGSSTSGGGGGTTEVPQTGGPTAICEDGTYSYSANRRGTCSHHGGVATWLI